MIHRRKKKPIEFSKLILIVAAVVNVAVYIHHGMENL